MPLLQETTNPNKTNPNQTETNTRPTNDCGFETNPNNQNRTSTHQNQTQSNSKPQSGLFSLPPSVMKLVPWIPLMLEMTTGQKIPQMSGTVGEIQSGIQTIQMNQVQIIQQQQNLNQRLIQLETNANNHLTNLTHQFNSLRLTHTREKEKKEIAYHNQPNLENTEES